MLQNDARHVADIAVLYPIATLKAGHYLDGELGHYRGGVAIPEADYVDVGELLATPLGRDYTFLHPEVLDDKCDVEGDTLRLNNRVNHETYKVMIIPGHKTIYWSNLKKIKAFYDRGGKVIATGTLPHKSAEFGHDDDVVKTIETLFPGAREASLDDGKPDSPASSRNERGGMAVFLKTPTARRCRTHSIACRMSMTWNSRPAKRFVTSTRFMTAGISTCSPISARYRSARRWN